MPQEILIVKLAALGDIVTSSTLVTRIRAERPDARITWVTGTAGAAIVRLFAGVDDVIEADEVAILRGTPFRRLKALLSLWRKLAGRRCDLAIVPHADARYRWLVPMVPASRLRKFSPHGSGGPNPIPGRFIGDEAARLLDPPDAPVYPSRAWDIADVRERAAMVELPPAVSPMLPAGDYLVLVPGGARNVLRDNPLRRWPLDRYAEVAQRLSQEGHRVAIVGDGNDAWVSRAFDGIPVIDLVGELGVQQTIRVLAGARLVVTHDTGPLHFARLVRTPVIALFGPTAPRQMIGEPENVTVLWGGATLACRPCYDGRDFAPCRRNLCIEEVTVGQVLDAVAARLESAAR
jgi:heptosyltransferase II